VHETLSLLQPEDRSFLIQQWKVSTLY